MKLLLLDFLAFCFVQPAQALLNSTPQFFARDRGAVAQGAQLGSGDLRMDAAQAAVSAKRLTAVQGSKVQKFKERGEAYACLIKVRSAPSRPRAMAVLLQATQ